MTDHLPALVDDKDLTVPSLPGLDQHQMAKLAREVAMDIQDLDVVLKDYNLTPAQFESLQKNIFFKRVLDTAIIEWNSALSTNQRIKIEAAAILEDSLHRIGARMIKEDENLPAVVEAAKVFAKLAEIGESNRAGAAGEKFTININLGADQQIRIEKDVTPKATDPLTVDTKANT